MRIKYSIALSFTMCFASLAPAATRYAKTTGSGNCSTWANACSLATALSGASAGDQVWVKAGTYGGIVVPNAVKVIGGFAGTETAASQSNPTNNPTILDGGDVARAVMIQNCSSTTQLRGFTVTNGLDTGFDGGGGMFIKDSSPLVVQCVFHGNVATYFGGAVAITGTSDPKFINCKFHSNGTGSGTSVTPYGGGAVFAREGNPTFTNCLFHGNKAGDGGAVLIQEGAPTFLNCTLADNQAAFGGGGGLFDQDGAAIIKNSIFWDNSAARGGDQILNAGGTTTITYSDVEGGWTGTGNINANPSFVSVGSGDYSLPTTSSCKDVGSNSLVPADAGDLDWDNNTTETLPKDLGGYGRVVRMTVDMGAYEAEWGIEE